MKRTIKAMDVLTVTVNDVTYRFSDLIHREDGRWSGREVLEGGKLGKMRHLITGQEYLSGMLTREHVRP